jgi:hypothetical protein
MCAARVLNEHYTMEQKAVSRSRAVHLKAASYIFQKPTAVAACSHAYLSKNGGKETGTGSARDVSAVVREFTGEAAR